MKNRIQKTIATLVTVIIILLPGYIRVHSQTSYKIGGQLIDRFQSPVSYATVALYGADSSLVGGTISDTTGYFRLSAIGQGIYRLEIRLLGYQTHSQNLRLDTAGTLDLGILVLKRDRLKLEEVKVTAKRRKARQQTNRTTYYVNADMEELTNNGVDMVGLLPGVQVDLFRKISLEGKQDILVLVNGVKRSTGFLSQLNSEDIDRIEIIDSPGVRYGSGISGVINVILKEKKGKGIQGHVYTEVPVNPNEIYSFPNASLHYTFNRMNIYTSYNGELSFFDLETKNLKEFRYGGQAYVIHSNGWLRQKSQSHRVNLGMDLFLNDRNQLNLLAFARQWSDEHDGRVGLIEVAEDSTLFCQTFEREDSDLNRSAFVSAFYRHLLPVSGREFTLELNYYRFSARNHSMLIDFDSRERYENRLDPSRHTLEAHLDFILPMERGIRLETGAKLRSELQDDTNMPSFLYRQWLSSAYASLFMTNDNWELGGGLRLEYARSFFPGGSNRLLSFLPALRVNYRVSDKSHVRLSVDRSLKRPHLYHLNPLENPLDPYTTVKGNPHLQPAHEWNAALDYSVLINNNFITLGTFWERSTGVIEGLTYRDDSLHFTTLQENLGDIIRAGVKLSGSVSILKKLNISPYLELARVTIHAEELALEKGVKNRSANVFKAGLTASAHLPLDMALSLSLNYISSKAMVQGRSFEDLLYFLSLDKKLGEHWKIGVTTALPFARNFTYQGHEIRSDNFRDYAENTILLSKVTTWFHLKYSFSSGRKRSRIEKKTNFREDLPEKGF